MTGREQQERTESDDASSDEERAASQMRSMCKALSLSKQAKELLVVFDMDHTMVGDLVSLSDRDNVETNMPWVWWPDRTERGLGPAKIVPYLQRGMMRPGLPELLSHLRMIGATIVVYTHSEDRWAVKVCQALERCAGWPFIHRVYSRMDCRDGHREFAARKSLEYIVQDMKDQDALHWLEVNKSIMFDDDANALSAQEADRLVTVASYDHWEPCPWDENVNEAMLAKNPEHLAQIVRASVVDWGIAPPSYALLKTGEKCDVTSEDLKWASKMRKKQEFLLSFNKLVMSDRVMYDILDALSDASDLEALPRKVRQHLSKLPQPQSRRVSKSTASTATSSRSSTPASAATPAALSGSASPESASGVSSASSASGNDDVAAAHPSPNPGYRPKGKAQDQPPKKSGKGPMPMQPQEAGAWGPAPGPEEPPSGRPRSRERDEGSSQLHSGSSIRRRGTRPLYADTSSESGGARWADSAGRVRLRSPEAPPPRASRSSSPLALRAKVREVRDSRAQDDGGGPERAERKVSPSGRRLSPVSVSMARQRMGSPAVGQGEIEKRRQPPSSAGTLAAASSAQEAGTNVRAARRQAADAKRERVDRLLGQHSAVVMQGKTVAATAGLPGVANVARPRIALVPDTPLTRNRSNLPEC